MGINQFPIIERDIRHIQEIFPNMTRSEVIMEIRRHGNYIQAIMALSNSQHYN